MTTPTQKQAGARTQHTPGPWRYCMFADHMPNFVIRSGKSNMTLATVNYYAGNPNVAAQHDITQGEANARLIAAAPELLEACKRLIAGHTIGGLSDAKASKDFARAAIVKAEGRAE